MKREPTEDEHRQIIQTILTGDRVGAIHLYISVTECGLTEAQDFIKTLTSEVVSSEQERQSARQIKRANFWHRVVSSLKR
jgi:ribosomal protein L7/L12